MRLSARLSAVEWYHASLHYASIKIKWAVVRTPYGMRTATASRSLGAGGDEPPPSAFVVVNYYITNERLTLLGQSRLRRVKAP